jgi:hypothetical protein
MSHNPKKGATMPTPDYASGTIKPDAAPQPQKKLADVLPELSKAHRAKKPIEMADGIFPDLPPELYYGTAAIGSSLIKWLAPQYTPADFWERSWMNPHIEPVDTKALQFGRAMHTLVLEPNAFETYFGIKRGVRSTTMQGMVGEGDYERMLRMRDRLMANTHIARLLTGGKPEVSLFWKHESGAPMRGRFDYLNGFTSVDLKFVEEISDTLVGELVARYQYDTQAAQYHDGLSRYAKQKGHDGAIGNHVIIFQEKAAGSPHKVVAVVLEDDVLAEGKSKYEAACRKYQECVAQYGTDKPWPAYEDKVLSLDGTMMPRWWSGAGNVV